jgi:hypothetical protein
MHIDESESAEPVGDSGYAERPVIDRSLGVDASDEGVDTSDTAYGPLMIELL